MKSMASSGSSSRGIAAIVGVGPKLGRLVARKFAHQGYTVAILARDLGRLSKIADEIAREEKSQVFAIRIDCSDSKSVMEAFEGVLSVGFVEILVYNANQTVSRQPTSFTDVRIDSFEKSLAVSSVGAFHCAQQVLEGMVERRRGTILFTGCSSSFNGIAGFSERCCGKFALRALSQCLARELHPLGIHVAHVVIDGLVGSSRNSSIQDETDPPKIDTYYYCKRLDRGPPMSRPGAAREEAQRCKWEESMDPDSLALTYWHLHVQDKTAWTQEIDLRPSHSRLF